VVNSGVSSTLIFGVDLTQSGHGLRFFLAFDRVRSPMDDLT